MVKKFLLTLLRNFSIGLSAFVVVISTACPSSPERPGFYSELGQDDARSYIAAISPSERHVRLNAYYKTVGETWEREHKSRLIPLEKHYGSCVLSEETWKADRISAAERGDLVYAREAGREQTACHFEAIRYLHLIQLHDTARNGCQPPYTPEKVNKLCWTWYDAQSDKAAARRDIFDTTTVVGRGLNEIMITTLNIPLATLDPAKGLSF